MSADEIQSLEKIRNELTEQAYSKEVAGKITGIRKELASKVYEAKKSLIKEQKEILAKRDESVKGVDKFWPTVLEKSELVQFTEETDKEALSHLNTLTVEYSTSDPREFTVHFEFASNPYFSNSKLSKNFTVPDALRKELPYDLEVPVTSDSVKIDWKDDKHNLVKKNPRPDLEKLEEYDEFSGAGSFFNFFTAPEDIGIAQIVLSVYEGAHDIFAGLSELEGESDDDDDEDEDEEDDPNEEVDLGDSEEDMPKGKKRKVGK